MGNTITYPPLYLTSEIALATERSLAKHRLFRRRTERIVYWAGLISDQHWSVTSVIEPVAHLTEGSFRVEHEVMANITRFVHSQGLKIIGQVHTHPGAFVEHSRGDDEGLAFPQDGRFSLVVPHYGQSGLLPLAKCGVYRIMNRQIARIEGDQIDKTIRIIQSTISINERRL